MESRPTEKMWTREHYLRDSFQKMLISAEIKLYSITLKLEKIKKSKYHSIPLIAANYLILIQLVGGYVEIIPKEKIFLKYANMQSTELLLPLCPIEGSKFKTWKNAN